MKMYTKVPLYIVSVLIVCFIHCGMNPNADADTIESLFVQANELYEQEKYTEARELYEQLVHEHTVKSAEVFYNIGNCYYRENNLGQALVNYKRALRISPRDKSIKANIDLARGLVQYKVVDTRNWYIRKIDQILTHIALDELYMSALVLLLFLLLVLIARLYVPKNSVLKQVMFISLMMVILAGAAVAFKAHSFYVTEEAVVTDREAEVRYGPSANDKVAFRLSAGMEVCITATKEDWLKIELRSGKEGWIKKESVAKVCIG